MDDPEARRARRLVRASTTGTLVTDGRGSPLRFVLDPRTGGPVFCTDAPLLDADDLVLCLPDDSFDALARVALTPRAIDRHDGVIDRFVAYHGQSPGGPWFASTIAFVKLAEGPTVDGDALMLPNPFLDDQSRLCRRLNADPSALRGACGRLAGVKPDDPVAVGVDPDGVDVRARFGVVRLELDLPTLAHAERTIERLLAGAAP